MALQDFRNDDLSIVDMVYARLPYLAVTENNDAIIGQYALEVMHELEPCFQVSLLEDGTVDPERIGQEVYYTIEQRSIVADLVTVYILVLTSAQNAQGSAESGSTGTGVRYMKKAKAGTAEVEWDALDLKKSGVINIGGAGLIDYYQKSAARKARNLGCIIDICTDCVGLMGMESAPLPFIVVSGCGCGC